ncbi:MAG: DNA polymerase III subunit alpha [Thiotrichaceae bacterium]|nr:DNA polymerase III subunit alpha [Thiotrichaceae bacterium]
MSFVHLRLHSEYSLNQSTIRLKPLAQAIVAGGMSAVALTDTNNVYALVKFFRAMTAAGIKPIFGVDCLLRNEQGGAPFHFNLLCQTDTGYLNLCRLISKAFLEGQSLGVPMVNKAWLPEFSEGLIVLSGARLGDVGQAFLNGNPELATRLAKEWAKIFPDRYYLELQRTGRKGDEESLHQMIDLATELDLPVVATNDVQFLKTEGFYPHEARVCITEGYILDDPKRPKNFSEQQYCRSAAEMEALFADIPEAIENTVEIAKRCNVTLKLGKNYLPSVPMPEGMTADTFFVSESKKGLELRLDTLLDRHAKDFEILRKPYDERLQIELDVILGMGFPSYFLIVADFIQWAKDNDIPVGPGRGSGAGSLVAYAMKITDLDPLEYDLLFERFLNPERISMPDFDIDFCMDNRDRVIQYVVETYGRDKVSQIITHGSMAAKAVVRDTGRVLGHGYLFVDRIAKLIPMDLGMTLSKALVESTDLKHLADTNEEVGSLIKLALSLEGLTKNTGKHAGGVLISPSELTDFTPLHCDSEGKNVVSQYDMNDVEAVGLVKFDFLGLRNLTIIDWALKMVNAQRFKENKELLKIEEIDLKDKASFDLLKDSNTTAVFQLESRGMKDLIKRLQPDVFEDIIALVALYRPGPLGSGMVDDFVDRKHGKQKVEYPHPDLEPILKPTYGVILYQEQVMQIAQVLASYTLGGADMLRRAMGKKKVSEMEKQRAIFLKGALANNVEEDNANYIFDLMEKFAGYGFNKSHSAAYALVSFQTAWLKAHYPAEFMAAVASSDMDNTEKVVIFIDDCKQMKLKIVSPDINRSHYKFTVDNEGQVVYGLGAIKGVGESAVDMIVENRIEQGEFSSLLDLCKRVSSQKVSKRVLETLIFSGALDQLSESRSSLMAFLPKALKMAAQYHYDKNLGQTDLFGVVNVEGEEVPMPIVDEWELKDKLSKEKNVLGLYLSGHPIDIYGDELKQLMSHTLVEVINMDEVPGGKFAKLPVILVGIVAAIRIQNMDNGKRAFFSLDDGTTYMEIAAFNKTFEEFGHLIVKDEILLVEGTMSKDMRTGGIRLRVDALHDIASARNTFARYAVLNCYHDQVTEGLADKLAELLYTDDEHSCPVYINYQAENSRVKIVLGDDYKAPITDDILQSLRETDGVARVQIVY